MCFATLLPHLFFKAYDILGQGLLDTFGKKRKISNENFSVEGGEKRKMSNKWFKI